MVRPKQWVQYHMGTLRNVVGDVQVAAAPHVERELAPPPAVYPVRDPVELITACMSVMMDANLALQIGRNVEGPSTGAFDGAFEAAPSPSSAADAPHADESGGQPRRTPCPPPAPRLSGQFAASNLFDLAPEILTINSGGLDPFVRRDRTPTAGLSAMPPLKHQRARPDCAQDFMLTREQHRELYNAGQLCTHLHAAQLAGSSDEVMCGEDRLKTLLLLNHMDYPKKKPKKKM
jgi:hypothetical protein